MLKNFKILEYIIKEDSFGRFDIFIDCEWVETRKILFFKERQKKIRKILLADRYRKPEVKLILGPRIGEFKTKKDAQNFIKNRKELMIRIT